MGGIENGGWRLGWTNEVPPFLKLREESRKFTDLNYSLGFALSPEGGIGDVLPGSPADKAGVVQGHETGGRGRAAPWSTKNCLRDAVKASTTNREPVKLLTVSDDFYQVSTIYYHGGEKYPVLERVPSKPDLLLSEIRYQAADACGGGALTILSRVQARASQTPADCQPALRIVNRTPSTCSARCWNGNWPSGCSAALQT